jgi:hypothetical protein
MKYIVKSNYEDIINKLLKKRKYFKDNDIINFILNLLEYLQLKINIMLIN